MTNLLLQAGAQPISGTTVAITVIAVIALIVFAVSKLAAKKTACDTDFVSNSQSTASGGSLPAYPALVRLRANQSAGCVELQSVSEADAAMIMAIVSDESKTPLNELYFKSIKLLDQQGGK